MVSFQRTIASPFREYFSETLQRRIKVVLQRLFGSLNYRSGFKRCFAGMLEDKMPYTFFNFFTFIPCLQCGC